MVVEYAGEVRGEIIQETVALLDEHDLGGVR
jgi:hypothetical protein